MSILQKASLKYLFIAAAFLLKTCFSSAVFAQESRSIAVLGFINLGGKFDASVNKTITRSLITFLSKIPEINITSYEAVGKAAADNKYWESKSFSPDAAVDMGLSLAVSQVVSGDYAVDHKKGTVIINVYVYDTVSAAMKLQRKYTGEAGPELFDTVDRMIRNVSTLITGRTIKMGRLEVEIEDTNAYKLGINGKFMKKISKSDSYSDIEIAEEPLDITLSVPATEKVIYRTNVSIGDGLTVNITYNPNPSPETGPKQTGKMKIAILKFKSQSGADEKDLIALTKALRTEISKAGLFEVIPGTQLSNILQEARIDRADLTSEAGNEARKKLGKQLNAKLAVIGVINSAFKYISMDIRLLDLETGEILLAETPSCKEDGVFKEIHEIALDIEDKFSNTRSAENNKPPKPETLRIVSNNLIPAGYFPDGSYAAAETPGKWWLFQDAPGKGSINISSNTLTIMVDNRDLNSWGVQVNYNPVPVKYGRIYTLSFDVRSDEDRKFFIKIGRSKPDWKPYFNSKRCDSTTEWQTINFEFKSLGTDDNAKIEFDCATEKPTIYIRNVSLTESQGGD